MKFIVSSDEKCTRAVCFMKRCVHYHIKMASLLAVQRLFSMKIQKNELAVDPPSMAYGKSRNAKKPDLGLFILELLAKI